LEEREKRVVVVVVVVLPLGGKPNQKKVMNGLYTALLSLTTYHPGGLLGRLVTFFYFFRYNKKFLIYTE
jgi:hypothetical protein